VAAGAPRAWPEEVGARKLEIGLAGHGLPASALVDLEGALGPQLEPGQSRAAAAADYRARMQDLVNGKHRWTARRCPTLYGQWHAAEPQIPNELALPGVRNLPWLRELNLNPSYRVAAGLGARLCATSKSS